MPNEQQTIQATPLFRFELKRFITTPKVNFIVVAGLHFFVALYYQQLGFDINFMPWDELWQSLPADLLHNDLLKSLWHFHAQPPVFNAFMGLLVKLFYPNHLNLLYIVNVILGSLLAGMIC